MCFGGLHAVVSSKSLLTVPCCKGGLLAALDVDGAELLHAPQASGWHTGVGKVSGLLVTARAAGGGQAVVTWQGRAPRGRIVLHWALHAVLLEQLLIYELVVLAGEETVPLLSVTQQLVFNGTFCCAGGMCQPLGCGRCSLPLCLKIFALGRSSKRNGFALSLSEPREDFALLHQQGHKRSCCYDRGMIVMSVLPCLCSLR